MFHPLEYFERIYTLSDAGSSWPNLETLSSSEYPPNLIPIKMTDPQLSPRTFYSTRSPYEHKFGYYRALRRKSHIFVSGTTAISIPTPDTTGDTPSPPPQIQFPHNARQQTIVAFQESIRAVRSLGGHLSDVVRVRMYVAKPEDCGAVGEGFREVFGKKDGLPSSARDGEGALIQGEEGEVGVVATMVVVKDGFVEKDMLVEVEVDAIVD